LRPASRRVFLYRGAGAPALVRTIVLTWRRPAHRPHGYVSQARWASLYARWLLLAANFYEKALFVKGDLATDRSVANATALPFALCFYPHFRGAHASVARCIMGSVFSG
jgi:hypothetical protein